MALLATAAASAAPTPPPLEAYGRLPVIEMMALSPKGDRYALIGMDGAERKLIVRDTAGALIHDVKIHELKVRGLEWVDDDHLVVRSTIAITWKLGLDEKSEDSFILTLNPTRHLLSVLLANQFDLYHQVFGVYGFSVADGHAYGYFGGIRQVDVTQKGTGYANLYRIDLDNGDHLAMARGDATLPDWFVDPRTGSVAATVVNGSENGDWRIMVRDKAVAQGHALFGRPYVLGYGREGRTLLVARQTDANEEFSEVSLDGSATTVVPDSDALVGVVIDRSTARWIGKVEQGDRPVVHLFDPALDARLEKAGKACGGARSEVMSHDDTFDHVIIHTEGAGDAGTYCLADTATGATRTIGKDYPSISAEQIAEARMVEWKAADGLTVHGVLTLPPGRPAHALPLIVLPHGGPYARDYPDFDWWAQAFVSRGYAVLQPNFRGSSGYGYAFTRAGFGEWGRKMQTDISDGMAALAAQGVVDSHRACIVGGSYGGYAALAGVTIQQGLYRCAISWGGVADPAALIKYDTPWGTPAKTDANRYWRRFMGVENKPINLDDISPLHFASRADAPVLLMYGTDDTVVAPSQSVAMTKALQKAGRPVETLAFKGEDHWLSKSATRAAMLNKAVAFALKYDPPD